MIRELLRPAYRLDAWLDAHIGGIYRVVLVIGLVVGIVASVRDLPHKLGSGGIVRAIVTLLFFAALLVNQLAELYRRLQDRRERRASRSRS
jgi:uncharacterized membrane protein YhaH (DUF805 family)